MESMATLTAFFGWCTVINMAMLVLASITLISARGFVTGIHGRMFGLSEEDLSRAYFQYLALYKVGIFLFNLVPYVALKILA